MLYLSDASVIALINGLFSEDFPRDSEVAYSHTENIGSELNPEHFVLELDFGERGKFDYPVPAMKFLAYSVEEICQKQMTILLPLYLLKLRREVENAKRRKRQREAALRECARKLKELIDNNLLPAIAENEKTGNITHSDAFELIKLLSRLYDYLYGGIDEFKDEGVKSMLSDMLVLEYDVELANELEKAKRGFLEEKKDAARKMKKYGISFDKIADIIGLSLAEVEQL